MKMGEHSLKNLCCDSLINEELIAESILANSTLNKINKPN